MLNVGYNLEFFLYKSQSNAAPGAEGIIHMLDVHAFGITPLKNVGICLWSQWKQRGDTDFKDADLIAHAFLGNCVQLIHQEKMKNSIEMFRGTEGEKRKGKFL